MFIGVWHTDDAKIPVRQFAAAFVYANESMIGDICLWKKKKILQSSEKKLQLISPVFLYSCLAELIVVQK